MAGMAGVSALGMALWSTLGLGALAATVWLAARLSSGRGWQWGMASASAQPARLLSAEEILRERYARGEIDIETLRNILAELYRVPDAR